MNINKLWRKIEKTFKLKLDSAGNVINLIQYSFSKSAYETFKKNLNFVLAQTKYNENHLNQGTLDQMIHMKNRHEKTFSNHLSTKTGYLKTRITQ